MALYPSSLATNGDLYVAVDNFSTTLNGAIDASQTTITLTSTVNLPTTGGILTIESEKVRYAGVSGNDITGVTRGFSATSAASHADAATVSFNVVEEHHNVLKDEIIAIETDLRSAISGDLDDSVSPAATAADVKTRLDHIATKLKEINTGTDWKDAVSVPLTGKKTVATGNAYRFETTDASGNLQETAVTASRAVATDANGLPVASTTTATELGHVSGVTSAIQTQLDGKAVRALSNLLSVAINTSLVSDTDNTDDLGTSAINWRDVFIKGDIKVGSTTAIDFAASGAVAIRGTNTNDSAAAGFVGEYVENKSNTGTNFPTTATVGDAGSIPLTEGNWEITFQLNGIQNSATWTRMDCAVTTTAGNSTAGMVSGDNLRVSTWASSSTTPSGVCVAVVAYNVKVSSPTTYYGKVRADYSAGTPQHTHRLSAKRVR